MQARSGFIAQSSSYDRFAHLYSHTMAEDFARRAFPALQTLLLKQLNRGSHILDVCCGSGQIARSLLAYGFRVTGVDASVPMLRLARQTAPQALFFAADARQFSISADFDAAISMFNSLAHCSTAEELRAVFSGIRECLSPSRPFIFDLTTADGYSSRWRGEFQLSARGQKFICRPSYNPESRIARNDIILEFGPHETEGPACEPEDQYFLTVYQKCHTDAEIITTLHTSGFPEVRSFNAEHDLGMAEESGRTFFLAR
jgi:SAM-dependent methyltransferase